MAKGKAVSGEVGGGVLPKAAAHKDIPGERIWWMDLCTRLAGAAFSESAAEECFRKWMTPRAAANLMREV